MGIESIRRLMQENPQGVRVRMVDGKKYTIPHRDFVSFGPPRDTPEARRAPGATSFIVYEPNYTFRLVNALLVAEVSPLPANGHGRAAKRRGKKK